MQGLKPYIQSKLQNGEWQQGGKNIKYEKTKLNYECIDDEDQDFSYM